MKTIKAKVHMLPTEDRGYSIAIAFGSEIGGKLYYFGSNSGKHKTDKPQHLYITTDEKIKEGDWVHHKEYGIRHYVNKDLTPEAYKSKGWRKIIATTDPKLIISISKSMNKDKFPDITLPQISQSFIEDYCKAGGIDEVLVEVESIQEIHVDGVIKQGVKLNPDNTIIIHPVEEKMIPLSKVKELMVLSINFGKGFCGSDGQRDKWIKENL